MIIIIFKNILLKYIINASLLLTETLNLKKIIHTLPAPSFMSQHYLKYHFKSIISTINNKAFDEVNGNNIEIDVMNGNGRKTATGDGKTTTTTTTTSGIIRITENPLPL